jgi:hypothetical protein
VPKSLCLPHGEGPVTFSPDYSIQPPLDTAWFNVGQISQDLAGSSLFPRMTVCRMLGCGASRSAGELNQVDVDVECEYLCLLKEIAMYRLLLSAGLAVALQGATAAAGELPTFEVSGFPMTRHQVAVLGSANVAEQAPSPALTWRGMPASPHQVAVLTPRPGLKEAAVTSKTVGLSAR